MVKGKTVAIAGAIASIIAIGSGIAYVSSGKTGSGTTTSGYTLTLTTSMPSAPAGTEVPFTANLVQGGIPVSGQPVTLTDITTGMPSTTNTDSSGNADFNVTINTPGIYSFQATSNINGASSSSNTVSHTAVSASGTYSCYTAKCENLFGQMVCVPRLITQNTPCDGISSFNTSQEACANAGCAIG